MGEGSTDADDLSAAHFRLAALATAFLKHEHEKNVDGMQAIFDEIVAEGLVIDFIRTLSTMAVAFGRRLFGDSFPTWLQEAAIDWQGAAASGEPWDPPPAQGCRPDCGQPPPVDDPTPPLPGR